MTNLDPEHCEICGEQYAVWFAPSDVWNSVMRQGDHELYGFVCPTCFTLKAEYELEGITGWLVTPFNDGPVRLAAQVVLQKAVNEYEPLNAIVDLVRERRARFAADRPGDHPRNEEERRLDDLLARLDAIRTTDTSPLTLGASATGHNRKERA